MSERAKAGGSFDIKFCKHVLLRIFFAFCENCSFTVEMSSYISVLQLTKHVFISPDFNKSKIQRWIEKMHRGNFMQLPSSILILYQPAESSATLQSEYDCITVLKTSSAENLVKF